MDHLKEAAENCRQTIERSRKEFADVVEKELRAGTSPYDIAEHTGHSYEYIRRIARARGVPRRRGATVVSIKRAAA